ACPYLGALNPDGDGTIRDQLSLAVAIAGGAIYHDGWMANTVPAVIPCVTAPPSRSKSSWSASPQAQAPASCLLWGALAHCRTSTSGSTSRDRRATERRRLRSKTILRPC